MKDRVSDDIGAKEQIEEWADLDWQRILRRVKNLRQRIYRATCAEQWNRVRSLMKLMLRSYSNLLLSVRKVTQINQGRKTAGVDRQVVLTPDARIALTREMLEHSPWATKPTRRVYIPKANGKQRPLGIPTIKNRVAQAIVKNALEPSWEARFEAHSYGFRPGRSCHDAIMQCWIRLNRHGKDKWVLDADIKGAFDNISHEHILSRIGQVPGRELIKQWLKAGYVEADIFHPTTSGTPQGGPISPLLANIALDGMEKTLPKRVGFIRYADDFVITARTREEIEAVKPAIERWLGERGLEMSLEKTRIVSIEDGFNFLGFTVVHLKGKCLTKPQKDKVLSFLQDIREWLKDNQTATAENVIWQLNRKLLGWANYYKHAASAKVFDYVNHQLWKAIWIWCLRRHRDKGKLWVKRKYFRVHQGQDWRFCATTHDRHGNAHQIYLANVSMIRIQRHVKVKGTASPDDPNLSDYWDKRKDRGAKKGLQHEYLPTKYATMEA